jgi:hypothetical protein
MSRSGFWLSAAEWYNAAMRYSLRSLMIAVLVLPPLFAGAYLMMERLAESGMLYETGMGLLTFIVSIVAGLVIVIGGVYIIGAIGR